MKSILISIGKGMLIGFCGFVLNYMYTFNKNYNSVYNFIYDYKSYLNIKENEQSCALSLINNNAIKNYIIITPLAYAIIDYNFVTQYYNFNIIKYMFLILIQSTVKRFIIKEMERNNKSQSNYFVSFYNNLLANYPILKKNTYTYYYVIPTMISCYIVKPNELTNIITLISILIINHPYNKTTIDNLIILYNMLEETTRYNLENTYKVENIYTIDDNKEKNDNENSSTTSKEEFDTTININVAYQIGEELISNDDYVILDSN
jgi:hypothetical protein